MGLQVGWKPTVTMPAAVPRLELFVDHHDKCAPRSHPHERLREDDYGVLQMFKMRAPVRPPCAVSPTLHPSLEGL